MMLLWHAHNTTYGLNRKGHTLATRGKAQELQQRGPIQPSAIACLKIITSTSLYSFQYRRFILLSFSEDKCQLTILCC